MPWMWFLIAGLAAVAGTALLLTDRGAHGAHQRERRRWAALRGWRFEASDSALTQHWRHGVMATAGLARDLVTGSLFTPMGRRQVHVFDHVRGAQVSYAVVAVRRRARGTDLVIELWLREGSSTPDSCLTTLGRVGDRTALVSDAQQARTLVSAEFVFAVDALGTDVSLAWLERDWVLATVPWTASPARLERLLRALNEIANLLDTAAAENTAEEAEIADLAELASWSANE
jgi:hypothetical protein